MTVEVERILQQESRIFEGATRATKRTLERRRHAIRVGKACAEAILKHDPEQASGPSDD